MPLSAIVTPATLTIVTSAKMTPEVMNVPMVDFSNTSAIYNKDENLLNVDINTADNGITPFLDRLMAGTASGTGILPTIAIAPAANYSLQFFAPSVQCVNAPPNVTAEIRAVLNAKDADIGPDPDEIPFIAFTPQIKMLGAMQNNQTYGDYSNFFDSCVATSAMLTNTTNSKGCDGMAYYVDKMDREYITFPAYVWVKANDNFLSCAVRDTQFNITFNATGNLQTINHPYKFEYTSQPLNDSHYVHGQIMSNWLSGVVFGFGTGIASYRTQITQTALYGALKTSRNATDTVSIGSLDDLAIPTADKALARNLTMGQLIEELSRNLTLSFFSADRLWMPGGINTTVNIGSTPNIYKYNSTNLFWAYGLAIAVTVVSVAVGMRALVVNGVSHETSFSSILCSTRNRTLDDLTSGYSLAAEPLGSEVKDTKLKFGVLRGTNEYSSIRRVGFGIDGEVDALSKGARCY